MYAVTEALVKSVRERYCMMLALGDWEEEEERRGVNAGSVRWRERVGCAVGRVVMVLLLPICKDELSEEFMVVRAN